MGRCWGSGLGCVSSAFFVPCPFLGGGVWDWRGDWANWVEGVGVLDREGNARKVVNCSCVVVRDWGEESQERSILLNYFQTEQ